MTSKKGSAYLSFYIRGWALHGKTNLKTTLLTMARVFQSLEIYMIISLNSVLLFNVDQASSPVFYSRARLSQWFDPYSLLFIWILHCRRSCPALLLVQRNTAWEMQGTILTFECCDWYIGYQRVQLVGRILILVALSGQTHTDTVRNVPIMKMAD